MPNQPSILIADDLPAIRKVLALCCRKLGYQTTMCEDGREALSQACSNSYHLIITCVQMPRMNGIEFCRSLRLRDRHQHTPVILCSSDLDQLDTDALKRELGRITFVPKPLNLLSLPRLIQASATPPPDSWTRESQRLESAR